MDEQSEPRREKDPSRGLLRPKLSEEGTQPGGGGVSQAQGSHGLLLDRRASLGRPSTSLPPQRQTLGLATIGPPLLS